jgi:hypothetical protein
LEFAVCGCGWRGRLYGIHQAVQANSGLLFNSALAEFTDGDFIRF